jgi:CRISPR type I-E-associated protein CasB/Cse2
MAKSPEDDRVDAILRWRGALHADTGAARAARARLRRCGDVFDALMLRETHELIHAVGRSAGTVGPDDFARRLAVLAVVLSRAPQDGAMRFAAALGRTRSGGAPSETERARLSPLRFGALMRAAEANDWTAFLRALRRALGALDAAPFNLAAFVHDILRMDEGVLQAWVYQYWRTLSPAETLQTNAEKFNETTD